MEQKGSAPTAGKTVLVTGANDGIGKTTALGLAAMGAHLAITGRDRERTEEAAREMRAAGGPVHVFIGDLSSQLEVRRLAADVLQSLRRIDVLINNVGGYWESRHVMADGLEHTFAHNHLAPFLLTNLLVDRLKISAPARVVTAASHTQAMGRIDFDDLQAERACEIARIWHVTPQSYTESAPTETVSNWPKALVTQCGHAQVRGPRAIPSNPHSGHAMLPAGV